MRFFEILFVPLQPKGCERLRVGDLRSGMTAHARQLMQASLLSLNRCFAAERLRNGRQTTKDNSKDNIDYGNN